MCKPVIFHSLVISLQIYILGLNETTNLYVYSSE